MTKRTKSYRRDIRTYHLLDRVFAKLLQDQHVSGRLCAVAGEAQDDIYMLLKPIRIRRF